MKPAKGHTLTEAVLTVAIVAILSSVAVPLLLTMTNFWRLTQARNVIQRDVRASLDMINRFTRQAKRGTIVLDRATGTQVPYSRITFTTVQGQTVSFWQNNNKLYMKQDDNVSVLSQSIAFLSFTFPRTDDTSLVSVAITARSPTYLGGWKALQLSIQEVRIMD